MFRVQGSELKVSGIGLPFGVKDLEFRVWS